MTLTQIYKHSTLLGGAFEFKILLVCSYNYGTDIEIKLTLKYCV